MPSGVGMCGQSWCTGAGSWATKGMVAYLSICAEMRKHTEKEAGGNGTMVPFSDVLFASCLPYTSWAFAHIICFADGDPSPHFTDEGAMAQRR